MAQNVGTPRFYVDIFSYLRAIGLVQSEDDRFKVGLNPTEQGTRDFAYLNSANYWHYYLTKNLSEAILKNQSHNNSVVGLLGHNFSSSEIQPRVKINLYENDTETAHSYGESEEIVNGTGLSEYIPEYDGFTLYKTKFSIVGGVFNRLTFRTRNSVSDTEVSGTMKLGSLFIGTYYDMPHSPDLNLKLSYEYDGVKTIQTKGGATLSNATYTKPADWGDGGAWQLGSDESGNPISNLRSGRRVWDLSFSYLSDTDLMPVVAATTNLGAGYTEGTPTSDDTLLEGTDFFSQVINRTMGGHLPFIFQADKSNNSPDQFAIARFDMNSFSYDQVANNVYNVKLKIREVW